MLGKRKRRNHLLGSDDSTLGRKRRIRSHVATTTTITTAAALGHFIRRNSDFDPIAAKHARQPPARTTTPQATLRRPQ